MNKISLVRTSLMLVGAAVSLNAFEADAGPSPVRLTELKTEHLSEPLGIDGQNPRLRWLLESEQRGQSQVAFQVLVASSLEMLATNYGDKWDSGKVASDNSVEVAYAGSRLASGERCYWKVRAWDTNGRPSEYSSPTFFEMGLLQPGDWQGQWIAAEKEVSAPLFRREIHVDAPVRRARAYVSGLGYYELTINGEKVGDRVLDPAPTTYSNSNLPQLGSRVLYASYDVTDRLHGGTNVVGVMLGRGWYSPEASGHVTDTVTRFPYGDRPRFLLQLEIELEDGRRLSVVSDDRWKTSSGPVTYNDPVQGESYDARLEQPGWAVAGFDDRAWAGAVRVGPPEGRLVAQSMEPARIVQTMPVVQRYIPTSPALTVFNTQVFDFGQNFSGWVRVEVKGPKGTRLVLKHGTRLHNEDCILDTRSNDMFGVSASQTDTYILKGEGVEVWEPRFTLHGFRYVQIHGLSGQVSLQKIEGRVVHSALNSTGSFSSSNDLLNRIHRNIHWTLRSSLQGIPQDAADRDERVAWLGDTTFTVEDYINNFDMAAFLEKWLADIKDAQSADGAIPMVVPNPWQVPYSFWPSWQSTYPVLVWNLYQYYGDRRVIEEHYAGLKRLADYHTAGTSDGLIADEPIGDHMEPQRDGVTSFYSKHTPSALTANVHYYASVIIVARCAEILGRQDEAGEYFAKAERIKDAFNRRFFDAQKNIYATGSQTSQALPLEWGLVPRERIAGVMDALVADIRRNDMHVTTGIIGTNSLMQVLPRFGAASLLYELANQTTFPSLGEQVIKGATTVAETYDGNPWNSQNMKMFCSWDKFFHRNLTGIQPLSPGYRRVLIRPQTVGDLRHVSGRQKTVRGEITVEWTKSPSTLELRVSVPAGVEAEIAVPTAGMNDLRLTEGMRPVWQFGAFVPGVAGLTGARLEPDAIVIQAGSGDFHFVLKGAARE